MRLVVMAAFAVLYTACTHDWAMFEGEGAMDDGLVLYLSMNDSSATTEPIGNHPIRSDADASEGIDGGGLSFDGTQSLEVDFGTPLQLGNVYSASLWFRGTDDATDRALLSCRGNPSFFLFLEESQQLEARAYDGISETWPHHRVRADVPADVWMHGAVTVNGRDVRLYLNGELVDERVIEEAVPAVSTQTQTSLCYVGRTGYSWEELYLVGEVDEVRIYDRELNPVEVESLANEFM